ncbi:MAG: phage terminase large subunit [Betaproteobacteria bacterium]|nr:phage terminase large subunit [Betaproteobacteria bacterium]
MGLNRETLALLLERERRKARADLYAFARWMFFKRRGFDWKEARHHAIVCNALMRVYRGECTRLIINIPPRYSKTELVNNFVAWSLGQAADSEFIITSYAAQLAGNNSWQIREIVQHAEYRELFKGVELRSDSAAKHEWRTTSDGIVYATGSGGTITGYGAGKHREGFGGAIIIDDPHKADEARSDTIRSGVIEWFQNTLESRKNAPERTPIILIMQRLHEADLAGWLLAGGNGETWEHVCLPAIQDDGAALWPEKHGIERLRVMQQAAPYTFAGQYQQRPAPPEGNIFKPAHIEIVDAVPVGTRFVRGWDFAASVEGPGKDPDWTAGGKLGITPSGRWIIADVERLRGGPETVESALLNTTRRDGSGVRVRIPQDPGQAGKSQAAHFTKLLAGFGVTVKPVSGDKITRAEPFAAQVNVGNVTMLRGEWNDALIAEMRVFPNGLHDDQVDALSDAFDELNINNFGLLDWMQKQAEQQTQG